jgi:hypothetical protein
MDDFDKLAISVASELLRSEAELPGSQDANLVKLAEAVLKYVGIDIRDRHRDNLAVPSADRA